MSHSSLAQSLPRWWYRRGLSLQLWPLLPFSWLFRLVVAARCRLYRLGVLKSIRLAVPVIVVGNLTVGGSGKTPLVIWLVLRLRAQGFHPGIISRGYGGVEGQVRVAKADSQAAEVGDEPLLLARRCNVPVFVGRDRVAAGAALLAAHPECDVIVSDDGLQHYRLHRDAEIVMFDGRGAGNGRLLPAGPLREPLKRLGAVTAIVWNSAPPSSRLAGIAVPQFSMRLTSECFHALDDDSRRCTTDDLRSKKLYALAGIGDPSRFFAELSALGLVFEAHPFPDHHAYAPEDLMFARDGTLLMTEKDAVKCASFRLHDAWMLPVEAKLEAAADGVELPDLLLEKINGCSPA